MKTLTTNNIEGVVVNPEFLKMVHYGITSGKGKIEKLNEIQNLKENEEYIDRYDKVISIHNNDISLSVLEDIIKNVRDGYIYNYKKLGGGCAGDVYAYNEKYAIKTIHNLDSDDDYYLKKLHHLDCIPNLYATFQYSHGKVVVMERILGDTVGDYKYFGENPSNIKSTILEDYDKALIDVMLEGIRPNDLHDDNVMIDNKGNIKIIDVGFFSEHDFSRYSGDEIRNDWGYHESWMYLAGESLRRYVKNYVIPSESYEVNKIYIA